MTQTTQRVRHALLITMIALTVAGCSSTKNWLNSVRGSNSSFSSSDPVLGAPSVDAYIEELGLLSSNDPIAQAEIIADSRAVATLTPNPSTRLRYALVLATPGHPDSDPAEAQNLLLDILTQTELMTAYEIALAQIYLKNVEERLVSANETRRLRASSSRAQRTQEAALNEQLARMQTENRELRAALEDAESKLEAITSIERSIRQQEQEPN
ncbi:MAG: hypothetical protein AAGA44_11320 [Pseudomonadota bacterium]